MRPLRDNSERADRSHSLKKEYLEQLVEAVSIFRTHSSKIIQTIISIKVSKYLERKGEVLPMENIDISMLNLFRGNYLKLHLVKTIKLQQSQIIQLISEVLEDSKYYNKMMINRVAKQRKVISLIESLVFLIQSLRI